MPCGHTIHKHCLKEMRDHLQWVFGGYALWFLLLDNYKNFSDSFVLYIYRYACPLCSKSVCDMSKVWEKYDLEIAATPMPEPYQNKLVSILCNDCGKSSEVPFHIVAQKCSNCKSYNTRQTRGWASGYDCTTSSEGIHQIGFIHYSTSGMALAVTAAATLPEYYIGGEAWALLCFLYYSIILSSFPCNNLSS